MLGSLLVFQLKDHVLGGLPCPGQKQQPTPQPHNTLVPHYFTTLFIFFTVLITVCNLLSLWSVSSSTMELQEERLCVSFPAGTPASGTTLCYRRCSENICERKNKDQIPPPLEMLCGHSAQGVVKGPPLLPQLLHFPLPCVTWDSVWVCLHNHLPTHRMLFESKN